MRKNFRRLSPPITTKDAIRRWGTIIGTTDSWLRGKAIGRLETKLAALASVDPECVVATDTCTNALAAAGHVVFNMYYAGGGSLHVCPLTYAGTYSWAEHAKKWVDCDEEGWPLGRVDVAVELWGRSVPHLWGGPSFGVAPIVDAAHRFRPEEVLAHFEAGSKAVCWSFGPMKELPGVRGGAAVFASAVSAKRARDFLNNGIVEGCPRGAPGRKGLMMNIDAVFLESQLRDAPRWQQLRQRVLEFYDRYFPTGSRVATLMTRPGVASGHLCVLRFPNKERRDFVRHWLRNPAIDTSVHYPVPDDAPPGAKELSGRILSLPCHPRMRFCDVRRICNFIIRAG